MLIFPCCTVLILCHLSSYCIILFFYCNQFECILQSRNLLFYILVRFIDRPGVVLPVGFPNFMFLCSLSLLFAQEALQRIIFCLILLNK